MTLLELMVAASVVLVGVVGLIQALTIGSTLLETSRNQTVAGQIMQHEINQMRLLSWSQIASLTTASDLPPDAQFSEVASDFTWARTVTIEATDMRKIKLDVTWISKVTGRSHTRSTETYLSKNGLHASYQRS